MEPPIEVNGFTKDLESMLTKMQKKMVPEKEEEKTEMLKPWRAGMKMRAPRTRGGTGLSMSNLRSRQ